MVFKDGLVDYLSQLEQCNREGQKQERSGPVLPWFGFSRLSLHQIRVAILEQPFMEFQIGVRGCPTNLFEVSSNAVK